MHAEYRLWPFGICLLFVPGALLLWGIGAAHHIHWFGLIVAMCLLSFCSVCGVSLSVQYMVDSYRELGAEALTTMICIRNTMSFGMGYA